MVVFGPDIYIGFRNTIRHRRRIRDRVKTPGFMERILAVASSGKLGATGFLIVSGALAVVVFVLLVVLTGSVSLFIALISLGTGALPLLIGWIRLRSLRVNGSYEGIDLITVFIKNYVVHGGNAVSALQAAVGDLSDRLYSQRHLAALSKSVMMYRSEAELRDALAGFVFAYQTEWARLFAFCLYIGIHDGLRIDNALDSIMEQFQRARQVMEKSKRYNRETKIILCGLIPISYVGLMLYGASLFGLPVHAVLAGQFAPPINLLLFFVMAMLAALCAVLSSMVSKPAFDL